MMSAVPPDSGIPKNGWAPVAQVNPTSAPLLQLLLRSPLPPQAFLERLGSVAGENLVDPVDPSKQDAI